MIDEKNEEMNQFSVPPSVWFLSNCKKFFKLLPQKNRKISCIMNQHLREDKNYTSKKKTYITSTQKYQNTIKVKKQKSDIIDHRRKLRERLTQTKYFSSNAKLRA